MKKIALLILGFLLLVGLGLTFYGEYRGEQVQWKTNSITQSVIGADQDTLMDINDAEFGFVLDNDVLIDNLSLVEGDLSIECLETFLKAVPLISKEEDVFSLLNNSLILSETKVKFLMKNYENAMFVVVIDTETCQVNIKPF